MKQFRSHWLGEQIARAGTKFGDKFKTYTVPSWADLTSRLGSKVRSVQFARPITGLNLRGLLRYGWRQLAPVLRYFRLNYKFTSLTGRILFYNMVGLATLVGGVLVMNQYRAGLIEVRVQNLLTQGKIIAEAIAASSSIDADRVFFDPEDLLEMQQDHDAVGSVQSYDSLHFPINPERAAPILLRLIAPTGTRARIYDREGASLLDSKALIARGKIIRTDLSRPAAIDVSSYTKIKRWFKRRIWHGNVPLYVDIGEANGKAYEEVKFALEGKPKDMSRLNERSELVVSVAIPIQRMRAVLGVLMLSTKGDDIDKIVKDELFGIIRLGMIALTVMLALSMWLSNQIGAPMRKLAAAARRVRHRPKAREEIPDFTSRTDEIGELSLALRNMTEALYHRIEAIEAFAADVAHELKNPLTSLKSAIETLPIAKKEEQRERLTAIILHDVKRLDRLISDISDASRLDAELAREETHPLDLTLLLGNIVPAFNDIARDNKVNVTLQQTKVWDCPDAFLIHGHDTRIGQVINNLVDNAVSFSKDEGEVIVHLNRKADHVEIRVEDGGPGIPPDNLEKVFQRFYTDRPEEQGFGNNSGLGLNISEQIISAHKGKIWAENRTEGDDIVGARFIIHLPAAIPCEKG